MSSATISRKRAGRGFAYYAGDKRITDSETLAYIDSLVIPPAWTNVEIATNKRAKVQASGIDAAGRKQAIYHPSFRRARETQKFERILQFGKALPKLRRQVERDLSRRRWHPDKVNALIVKLMDETYFRIGNETYAKAHETYGITTMRSKHLDITTSSVTFDFTGKSGKQHHKTISDRRVARLVKQLDDMPGYELFRYIDADNQQRQVRSSDVNEYIKRHMGDDFSAKDFRTWGGTLLASMLLTQNPRGTTEAERKKHVTSCIKSVAKELGNTPAVTRSSYVDPRIIDRYMKGNSLSEVAETLRTMRPRAFVSNEERCLLAQLNET
ncbi:MAG TPA: DNA topoisomerase IB [Patescibacteria group bacterium]|nr:DNA topoisomerase IB [Patescibacteria group bacterium]